MRNEQNFIHEINHGNAALETEFQIKLSYNFLEPNYKTDQFEMFFLDIKTPKSNKYIRICEQ